MATSSCSGNPETVASMKPTLYELQRSPGYADLITSQRLDFIAHAGIGRAYAASLQLN
jgi:hypothetical protein